MQHTHCLTRLHDDSPPMRKCINRLLEKVAEHDCLIGCADTQLEVLDAVLAIMDGMKNYAGVAMLLLTSHKADDRYVCNCKLHVSCRWKGRHCSVQPDDAPKKGADQGLSYKCKACRSPAKPDRSKG